VVAHGASYTEKPVPNPFWRMASCIFYMIPAIDTFTLGLFMYSIMPITGILPALASVHPHYRAASSMPYCKPTSCSKTGVDVLCRHMRLYLPFRVGFGKSAVRLTD
jgi:hypothetical protein